MWYEKYARCEMNPHVLVMRHGGPLVLNIQTDKIVAF